MPSRRESIPRVKNFREDGRPDMRTLLLSATLLVFLFSATPAMADDATDFIENEVDEWVQIAGDNGYTVLETFIGTVSEEDTLTPFLLAPGDYVIYASGGLNIADLDLFIINNATAERLGEDTDPDKIPIVEISFDEQIEICVQAHAWVFEEGFDSGYFCLVICADGEGEILEITLPEPVIETEPEPIYDAGGYITNEINEWKEVATGNEYIVLDSCIGEVTGEDTHITYVLLPGDYIFYASGGMNVTDLDMVIYDADGDEIGSDTEPDKIPIVELKLDERTLVEVQLTAWAFLEGYDSGLSCLVLCAEGEGEIHEAVYPELERSAGAGEFIENEMAEWTTIAENNDYNILDSYIGDITSQDSFITYVLMPGKYIFYASGGMDVADLDMFILDMDEDVLEQDTEPDKIPIVELLIEERTAILVQMHAWAFKPGYHLGYYCLVVCADGDGEIAEVEYPDNSANKKASSSRNPEEHSQDEIYREDVELWVGNWIEWEEEDGNEVTVSDTFLLDDDIQSITLDLESGFYSINAMADARCIDLIMSLYTPDQLLPNFIDYATPYPYADFGLIDDTELNIEFEVVFTSTEFYSEIYVGYVLSRVSDTDDDSRRDYIMDTLDWYEEFSITEGEELIDSWVGKFENERDPVTFEWNLDKGWYYFTGEGGLAITTFSMVISDNDGNFLNEYEFTDKYPFVWLELEEPTTVILEAAGSGFYEGFDDAYGCFLLASTEVDWMYHEEEYDHYPDWDGDEDVLIENAELLAEPWLTSAEMHDEEIIEQFTDYLEYEGEDEAIVYELDLDPGTYYVYVQGDGICLMDVDLVIYDENGYLVDDDVDYPNSASCKIEVKRGDGPYEAWVYAYWLDCNIGYFTFILTGE